MNKNKIINLKNLNEFLPFVNYIIDNKNKFIKCANNFETPLYVLDEELLLRRAKKFMNSFGKFINKTEFFYAFKSNDLPYQIFLLKNIGFNADVAGLFELKLALKQGFKKIIFTGPMKSEEEIKLSVKNNDRVILNIDNLEELKLLLKVMNKNKKNVRSKVKISFRIKPLEQNNWSKFGIHLNKLKEMFEIASENKQIKVSGLHFHSSWNNSPQKQIENITAISDYIKDNLSKTNLKSLEFFDIGGGFLPEGTGSVNNNDITYDQVENIELFAKKISEALEGKLFKILNKKNVNIFVEPGRYISSLPTSILLKVTSVDEDKIIVDGGINLLGSANFEFEYTPVINLTRPSTKVMNKKIFGPLCDPDDHWGSIIFGETCEKGDLLLVLHQGAYSFSTAWRWQKPIAAYVSFLDKDIKLVKETESFNQRYQGCVFNK